MAEEKVVGAEPKKGGSFKIPGHWIAIASFVLIFGAFVGFTFYFSMSSGGFTPASGLTKEEVELIVKDLNPMQQQQIAQNKKQRGKQNYGIQVAHRPEVADHQHGSECDQDNSGYVVSHQRGTQQHIRLLEQIQHQSGTPVSLVRLVMHLELVRIHQRNFRTGKKSFQ